eukprot:scaffold921_cov126-Cylindrotheca_fusiformis.AAC.16
MEDRLIWFGLVQRHENNERQGRGKVMEDWTILSSYLDGKSQVFLVEQLQATSSRAHHMLWISSHRNLPGSN